MCMSLEVIYASTSGNVEAVVEKAAEVLRAQGIDVNLHRAEQTPLDVITQNNTFILATSTWEHGELNHFFWRLFKEMKGQDFRGKRATFIGLGDMRYEPVLFNQGMKILRQLWLDQQGDEFHRQLLINNEPYKVLDTTVTTWANDLAAVLKQDHVN